VCGQGPCRVGGRVCVGWSFEAKGMWVLTCVIPACACSLPFYHVCIASH
jgi:hypothetical protein